MKFTYRMILSAAALFSVLSRSAYAGDTVRLRKGLVVPVRFEQELSLKENRRGDRFSAIVDEDRDLPRGTVLEGHVSGIEPSHDGKAGSMDLDFDSLTLPDGSRQSIDAVPIRLDDKTIKRGGDGRLMAKKKLEDSGKYVLGGMVGGYLLGRVIGDHKPGTGIMLGALAGILAAESERGSTANEIVVKRDAKMGALFERDASFEFDPSNAPQNRDDRNRDDGRYRNDRDPRDRDDRYNPFDPRNRDKNRRGGDDRGIVIEYRGHELRFSEEERPYREGDVWMVALDSAAEQLGMTVDSTNSRRILVEDDDTALILEQDSRSYRLNGKKAELPSSVVVKNRILYVPIDGFLAAKNGQIRINGTQGR